jgi:hypothetical protein
MSKENHGNHHGHHDHGHAQHKSGGGLHKDWRAWTVVILMLVAMAAYILSDDLGLTPSGSQEEPMPADAAM